MDIYANRNEKVGQFFGRGSSYLEKDFGLRVRAAVVRDFVGDVSGVDILDVGCGDGSISRQFWTRHNCLTLFDISPAMLELARGAAMLGAACELEFLQGDFLTHPFTRTFDLIICLGVLAHVTSAPNAVRVLGSLLKPGGRCIIQFTDHGRFTSRMLGLYQFWLAQRRNGYQVNRMSFREVASWARGAGLELVRFQRCGLPLPGMGRLPNELLYMFEMHTIRSRLLSRLATGVIGLYSKESGR
jgi:SAM-dependent methyltransferase